MTGALSLGVAAALDHRIIAELAPRMEAAGFASLWVNDTPGADALAALRVAADATERLTLVTRLLTEELRAMNVIPSLPATQVARTAWSPN